MKRKKDKVLGIISGIGTMPYYIVKNAKAQGYKIITIFVVGNEEKKVAKLSDDIIVVKVGQITKCINFFKKHGVQKAVMAGLVKHISIFGDIMPDLRATKILLTLKDRRAESLLNAIILEFKKGADVDFIDSSFFLKDFIASKGVLTKTKPNAQDKKDIDLAWNSAKTLAKLDIGLTAIVCKGVVIALEAIEGTNKCIKRSGEILKNMSKKKDYLVIAKVARPKQNMRFDLPVIGTHTIDTMILAKAKVLAVESKKTIILEKEEVIKKANKNNIIIVSF